MPPDVSELMEIASWDDYISMDDAMITNDTLGDNWEEVILRGNPSQHIDSDSDDDDNDDNDDDYEPIRDVISYGTASTYLEQLTVFALVQENKEMLDCLATCQHELESNWLKYKKTKQTTIIDFFKPKQ